MPVDPSISLQAPGAAAPPTNSLGGTLSTLGGFADVQNKLNQNQLFRQTMQARQNAGDILATTPDLNTAIDQMQHDPSVSPYIPEVMNYYRQAQLAQAQYGGEISKQARDGLDAVMKAWGSTAADPTQLPAVSRAYLATIPPLARQMVQPYVLDLATSMLDGLPPSIKDWTDADHTKYNQRFIANALTHGMPLEAAQMQLPKVSTQDTGGGIVPTSQAGPLGYNGMQPGELRVSGPGLAKTLAPQTVSGQGSEGQPVTKIIGGGGGAPTAVGPGANALLPARGTAPSGNALGGPAGRSAIDPNAVLEGPTQQQSAYNTQRMDEFGKYEGSLDDRVVTGQSFRKNMGEIIDQAQIAQTGGGAEARMKLGQLLQAAGFDNSAVDKMANGSLAASQVIDKASLTNTMNQLKQQLTGIGGSRINQQEFVAQLTKNPNLLTDPRAIVEVFNLWNQFYDRDKSEQRMLDAYKSGKPTGDKSLDAAAAGSRDLSRWPALWSQSDYMSNFAPGGPVSGAGVRGTSTDAKGRKPISEHIHLGTD